MAGRYRLKKPCRLSVGVSVCISIVKQVHYSSGRRMGDVAED